MRLLTVCLLLLASPALAEKFAYRCPHSGAYVYVSFDDVKKQTVVETAAGQLVRGHILEDTPERIHFNLLQGAHSKPYDLTLNRLTNTFLKDEQERMFGGTACEKVSARPALDKYDDIWPPLSK